MLVTLLESKWWGIEVAGAFKAAMTLTRSATCARSRFELTRHIFGRAWLDFFAGGPE